MLDRRQVTGLYRAVIVMVALVFVVGVPLVIGQYADDGQNNRLEEQNAELQAQARRLERLVTSNKRDDEVSEAQTCVSQHAGRERFRTFMAEVRDVVAVQDQAGFDHLLEQYGAPDCDLQAAAATIERLAPQERTGR